MKKVIILFAVTWTFNCMGQTKQNPTTTPKIEMKERTEYGWSVLGVKGFDAYAIFKDNFTANKDSSWYLLSEEGSFTAIEDNRLRIHLATTGKLLAPLHSTPLLIEWSEYEIRTIVDGKSNAFYEGIILGFEDPDNYTSITFSPKNKMMVYEKKVNGIVVGDDEATNVYLVENIDNEVRIVKKDGKIKVFFNGVEGYEIKDTKMTGTLVGLMAGGTAEMSDAYFKSFYVEIGIQSSTGFENNSKLNTVKVKRTNGVYSVPVELNGVLKIDFIFDSGASDISISPDIALTLLKAGTIKKEDWLPGAYYSFADGSSAKSERFKLHSVKIGNKVIKNATCSISNSINSPMLLGQSVLSEFGKYTFDNNLKVLTIE